MTIDVVYLVLPEIALVVVAAWTYVGSTFTAGRTVWSWFAVGGLTVAAWHLLQQHAYLAAAGPAGPIQVDALAYWVRWLAIGVGLLFVLTAARSPAGGPTGESVGSLLMVLAGLMLVAAARDLVLLFVALELISIPTYVLLFTGRPGGSGEATAKYFYLSILSSSLLLYGFSFLYGVTGTTELAQMAARLDGQIARPDFPIQLARLAALLIFAGLGFKIAAVPFHFYAPDVYQGTSHVNAGLLAVVPKIAGVVALVRLLVTAMSGLESFAWQVALASSLLTMTLGNILALWQRDLRRLMAYSSIAHAGYLLIGLTVALATADDDASSWLGIDGLGAMLLYLVVYAVATTGAFAALAYLGRGDRQIDAVDELAGLRVTHPVVAAALAVFMFSLAGIPPLAGFWGKFALFSVALDVPLAGHAAQWMRPWFLALAIVGALNAAIAAAYYLRVVAAMYFRSPVAPPPAQGGRGALAAALASAVVVVAAGCYPWPLIERANQASNAARVETADRELPVTTRSGPTISGPMIGPKTSGK